MTVSGVCDGADASFVKRTSDTLLLASAESCPLSNEMRGTRRHHRTQASIHLMAPSPDTL